MIADYDDDVKMAQLGRWSARYKAIKNARESIRDYAVMIGNADDVKTIENCKNELNLHVADLIEALLINTKGELKLT